MADIHHIICHSCLERKTYDKMSSFLPHKCVLCVYFPKEKKQKPKTTNVYITHSKKKKGGQCASVDAKLFLPEAQYEEVKHEIPAPIANIESNENDYYFPTKEETEDAELELMCSCVDHDCWDAFLLHRDKHAGENIKELFQVFCDEWYSGAYHERLEMEQHQ